MGRTKCNISRGLQTSPPAIVNPLLHYCLFFQRKSDNSLYLAESCLHPNAAQYNIVRVFPAYKYNIKANKNVTAHLNHVKKHEIHTAYVTAALRVKGLLAADWSKLQTLMNMSASTKTDIRPYFRTFRT